MIIYCEGKMIGETTPTSEGIWYRSSINGEWGFAGTRKEAICALVAFIK